MSWIAIFIVLLVLFFIPLEVTIFLVILTTAIYFWQVTLIAIPVIFILWLILMMLEQAADSVQNPMGRLRSFLFHLFDLQGIAKQNPEPKEKSQKMQELDEWFGDTHHKDTKE